MELITETLRKRFETIGDQSEDSDPLVIATFFNPCGRAVWFATEYSPDTKNCFGYVSGLSPGGDEWGYFSITELESLRLALNLRIERNIHFIECRFSSLNLKEKL
jgi:hypothetical protein